uniref:Uncharacterized protein n=1 Tax=Mus musculus TaxID=10090 RepID=Q8C7J0_MOUSE|nr:unnamed protein product [Mus musculus]
MDNPSGTEAQLKRHVGFWIVLRNFRNFVKFKGLTVLCYKGCFRMYKVFKLIKRTCVRWVSECCDQCSNLVVHQSLLHSEQKQVFKTSVVVNMTSHLQHAFTTVIF